MGEITEALRRARAEREAAAQELDPTVEPPKEESPPGVPAPLAPRNPAIPDSGPPPARLDGAREVVPIARVREGFWQARAVVMERPGAVAERFRHLAVRVRRDLEARGGRTLAVASALREEGKTVVSSNLALALASMASERRIALVDLDLRRPSVARAMGVAAGVGIGDVLRGHAPLEAARLATDVPSFDLYPAGDPIRHAHELLSTSALPRMLATLREQYAVVVVDTPPVLLVPDVPLIMPHFDACLVVARVGKTARSAFRDMLGLLPREKVLGGFLNQVRSAGHAAQYGYYLAEEDDDDDGPGPGRRGRA